MKNISIFLVLLFHVAIGADNIIYYRLLECINPPLVYNTTILNSIAVNQTFDNTASVNSQSNQTAQPPAAQMTNIPTTTTDTSTAPPPTATIQNNATTTTPNSTTTTNTTTTTTMTTPSHLVSATPCRGWKESTNLYYSSSIFYCFPGQTLVTGKNGPIAMHDLKVGDEILGFSEGKVTWTKVEGWLFHSKDAIMGYRIIETNDSKVDFWASDLHNIAIKNQSQIEYTFAENLKRGDQLYIYSIDPLSSLSVASTSKTVQKLGLYSPLTSISTYFISPTVANSQSPLLLVHSLSKIRNPVAYQSATHLLFKTHEFFGGTSSPEEGQHFKHDIINYVKLYAGDDWKQEANKKQEIEHHFQYDQQFQHFQRLKSGGGSSYRSYSSGGSSRSYSSGRGYSSSNYGSSLGYFGLGAATGAYLGSNSYYGSSYYGSSYSSSYQRNKKDREVTRNSLVQAILIMTNVPMMS